MSETKVKHTKGPWEIHLSEIAGNFVVLNMEGKPIVESFLCDDESAANVRLIAAAEELLEALNDILNCREINKFFDTRKHGNIYICRFCLCIYDNPQIHCANPQCPIVKARAAIAKAKGETE
jgi:hypothetical protein